MIRDNVVMPRIGNLQKKPSAHRILLKTRVPNYRIIRNQKGLVENKLTESNTMRMIRDHTKARGMATDVWAKTFSIGRNYWSQSHVDNDFYFTRLTVLAPEDTPHSRYTGIVIYYFVFPCYKVRIPLRSGDVLMFNPLVAHSCSNP